MSTELSKTCRVLCDFSCRGITKTVGEDDVTRIIAKMLPPELNKRISNLRTSVNNLNSVLKTVCGSIIDHPQGGIVSLAGEMKRVVSIEKVLEKSAYFAKEAQECNDEIKKIVASGEFASRLSGLLNGRRCRVPDVSYSTIVSLDMDKGQIVEDLPADKVGPEVIVKRLVPRDDEKFISIVQNLVGKMNETVSDVMSRMNDPERKKPYTREDWAKAEARAVNSVYDELDKIKVQLGEDTDQYKQIEDLCNRMVNNSTFVTSIMDDIRLSNGAPVSEAVDTKVCVLPFADDDDDIIDVSDIIAAE